MNICDLIISKLKDYPKGYGPDEVDIWLKDIPNIESLTDIDSVFFNNNLSYNQWKGLIIILANKYIGSRFNEFSFEYNYEKFIKDKGINDIYKKIYLWNDKSQILDFSFLTKELTKISISSNKVEKIIFPKINNIEALELVGLNSLTTLENIEYLKKLKYLTIGGCNKIEDFDFLNNFNDILYLYLAPKHLKSLEYLSDNSDTTILDIGSNIVKNATTINKLSHLKKLKYLYIKANKNELNILRDVLPNCVINYNEPLNKQIL